MKPPTRLFFFLALAIALPGWSPTADAAKRLSEITAPHCECLCGQKKGPGYSGSSTYKKKVTAPGGDATRCSDYDTKVACKDENGKEGVLFNCSAAVERAPGGGIVIPKEAGQMAPAPGTVEQQPAPTEKKPAKLPIWRPGMRKVED